jgi:nucleotide-binding universal stress UspA family protein
MKIDKILLPFDGSAYSVNAAKYALELAKLIAAHVHVVYCYEWNNLQLTELPQSLFDEIKANRKRDAEELLQKADGVFANQGINYTLEAVVGSPGFELIKIAKSKEYDLIVMGSHGHSDIAGLFLGSVTHKVLNKIYCPVLIVP